jgi:hypothetical protein
MMMDSLVPCINSLFVTMGLLDLCCFGQGQMFGHDKWCSIGVKRCRLKDLGFSCLVFPTVTGLNCGYS